ncbi:MAG: acetyltransferase [Planctomycetes bacterium]|nr:acetyltransferase [Planctomycetota bacterium]
MLLYVFGAGGHGKVVGEAALLADRFDLCAFLDDDPAKVGTRVLDRPIIAAAAALEDLPKEANIALGIGHNERRHLIHDRLRQKGIAIATIVHPSAMVSPTAIVEEGTFIGPLAIIHTEARIGLGCIINSGAVIEHDNVIGDYAHISPKAALGGCVHVGEGAHVGLGASVIPSIRIGARSIVGAGAAVICNIPARSVAVGVPAKVIKQVRD